METHVIHCQVIDGKDEENFAVIVGTRSDKARALAALLEFAKEHFGLETMEIVDWPDAYIIDSALPRENVAYRSEGGYIVRIKGIKNEKPREIAITFSTFVENGPFRWIES